MKKQYLNLETGMIVAMLLFGGIFFGSTYTFPETAALLPRIISSFMLFSVLLYIVVKRFGSKKPPAAQQQKEQVKPEERAEKSNRSQGINWYISSLLMFCFFALVYLTGFEFATFAYGAIIPYLLGYRNYKMIFLFATGMTAIIILVFGRLFMIPLPAGLLWELLSK